MTKTIKLSDVQSLNGKTNWLYLKSQMKVANQAK